MIYYDASYCVSLAGLKAVRLIVVQRVFRFSFLIALAAAIVGVCTKILDGGDNILKLNMPDNYLYGSFSGVVGFLLVFRTGHAYTRFAEGATLIHVMSSDFLDAASLLLALSRASTADIIQVHEFQRIVVRLFSCLNAVCLGDLGAMDMDREDFWTDGMLDIQGLDKVTVNAITQSACKPECVSQRIQAVTTDELRGILKEVPAPLLTRVFQELGQGMIRYHEALKLIHVPFPFPFVAVTEYLLGFHSIFTTLMVCSMTKGPVVAGVVSFTMIFMVWALYALAAELDNPFGTDMNDLDLVSVQSNVNLRLVALLSHSSLPRTHLSEAPANEVDVLDGYGGGLMVSEASSFSMTHGRSDRRHARPPTWEDKVKALSVGRNLPRKSLAGKYHTMRSQLSHMSSHTRLSCASTRAPGGCMLAPEWDATQIVAIRDSTIANMCCEEVKLNSMMSGEHDSAGFGSGAPLVFDHCTDFNAGRGGPQFGVDPSRQDHEQVNGDGGSDDPSRQKRETANGAISGSLERPQCATINGADWVASPSWQECQTINEVGSSASPDKQERDTFLAPHDTREMYSCEGDDSVLLAESCQVLDDDSEIRSSCLPDEQSQAAMCPSTSRLGPLPSHLVVV